MTDEKMTLLDAVESLQFMEMSAVSWINIILIHTHYVAHFTIAFVLPFLEAKLPDEFRDGSPRFWPDQKRLLKSREFRVCSGTAQVCEGGMRQFRDARSRTL